MRSRIAMFAALVLLPAALWATLPVGSAGAPAPRAKAAALDQKIATVRAKLQKQKGKAKVLTTDIEAYSSKIGALQDDIDQLQGRQDAVQADLDRQRGVLERTQAELRAERARLVRLKARLAETQELLAARLVEVYKDDEPDLMTVVLQADGFQDLLERSEFMGRVSSQDQRIIARVKSARKESATATARLGTLEQRQQQVAARILNQRNEVAKVKGTIVAKQSGFQRIRSERQDVLRAVRVERDGLAGHLDDLEKEQARVKNALVAAQNKANGTPDAGPIRKGSGNLIWPVNGPITGAFGEFRGDHYHAGIDIAASNGTPIRAADDGRVVLLGWTGGYGNYTCVQHTATMSTCYAHQSRYGTSMGANVKQGQVIGYVGNTGHSFGDHLHFEVRINGTPQNPLNYL